VAEWRQSGGRPLLYLLPCSSSISQAIVVRAQNLVLTAAANRIREREKRRHSINWPQAKKTTSQATHTHNLTHTHLTYQWIPSSTSSPPSRSPRRHPSLLSPSTPMAYPQEITAAAASLLRGHSSSTSASYSSSAASVSVLPISCTLAHRPCSITSIIPHLLLSFRSSRVSSSAFTGVYNDPRTFPRQITVLLV
jgi:hypothetical protein